MRYGSVGDESEPDDLREIPDTVAETLALNSPSSDRPLYLTFRYFLLSIVFVIPGAFVDTLNSPAAKNREPAGIPVQSQSWPLVHQGVCSGHADGGLGRHRQPGNGRPVTVGDLLRPQSASFRGPGLHVQHCLDGLLFWSHSEELCAVRATVCVAQGVDADLAVQGPGTCWQPLELADARVHSRACFAVCVAVFPRVHLPVDVVGRDTVLHGSSQRGAEFLGLRPRRTRVSEYLARLEQHLVFGDAEPVLDDRDAVPGVCRSVLGISALLQMVRPGKILPGADGQQASALKRVTVSNNTAAHSGAPAQRDRVRAARADPFRHPETRKHLL
ncbi:hypothetical protein KL932_000294 [Ogataea haglerorum]|nr:hypothetical protein KL932_000294 [Ogataea haglerorum]